MSRIKSSVKMGQGHRRRGPALSFVWPAAGAAGQFEIAAVTPRHTGAALAAPSWPPSARVSGWPRSTARPPQGSGDRRGLACAGALLWPAEVDGAPSAGVRDHRAGCGGRGTNTAQHPRAPRSGPPRSTTRRPRGSGDCRSPARAGAPNQARRGRAPARGGTPLCPAEKGGEVKNVAYHLSRNNA